MGLERLQSVFNNIDDNTQELEDGLPVESISNSLYDDFHSFGTQGNRSELISITKISKKQNPSPLMAINGIFAEDAEGNLSQIPINPVNGHNYKEIRINDNAGTNLLKTVNNEHGFGQVVSSVPDVIPIDLGKGRYILENIFDKTHGNNTPTVQTGPNDLQKDTLLFSRDENVAKMGGYNNLNIRKTQGYGGRGDEPHIVHPIGFSSPNERKRGYDRDGIPLRAAGEDASRLLNYYLSADGIQFMSKENFTNVFIGDGITANNPFRSLLLPPLPVPTTGFLNGYQQRMQANFPTIPEFEVFGKAFNGFEGRSGRSNRKPMARNYSEEFSSYLGRPFRAAKQGDVDAIFNTPFTNPIQQTDFQERDSYKIKFRFDTQESMREDIESATGAPLAGGGALDAIDATTNKAGEVGNVLIGAGQYTLDKLNPVKEAARKAWHVAKEKAREQIDEIINAGVVLKKQPLKDFSGLNRSGPGGKYKVIDNLSLVPPLDPADSSNVEKGVDPGDFYVRIQDLRKMTDGTAGKLLYFRGFVTGITENVNPTWNPTTYIGRSEDVYIYQKAERDLSFNLRVAPANKFEQEYMYQKLDRLTSLAYPSYLPGNGMNRMQPPFVGLYMAHIGSKSVGQFGFFKSITYTVNESGDWDALTQLPRVFDIALSYQILSKEPPNMVTTKFYNPSPADVNA